MRPWPGRTPCPPRDPEETLAALPDNHAARCVVGLRLAGAPERRTNGRYGASESDSRRPAPGPRSRCSSPIRSARESKQPVSGIGPRSGHFSRACPPTEYARHDGSPTQVPIDRPPRLPVSAGGRRTASTVRTLENDSLRFERRNDSYSDRQLAASTSGVRSVCSSSDHLLTKSLQTRRGVRDA